MSILHVNQIRKYLETEFKNIIDLNDQRIASSVQKDNFFLTRSLAAYAIQYYAEASNIIASYAVTDGSDDNGIDAIYYSKTERTLYLVQSKWIHDGKGEPENGDIKKFISGIKDIFNSNYERFNSKVNAKKELLQLAIDDFQTKYQIILVYTGINDLAIHSRRDIEDFMREINDASESVYFSVFNLKGLHLSLIKKVAGTPIDLRVTLKSWGRLHEPFKAFYGQVNGQEIYTWWSQYRNRLFKENIRGVLGDTNVNVEITKTLVEHPEHFWFFNNGITIIAKEANKNMSGGSGTDYGQFTCKDLSIVNGAQTVSCIGKFGENDPSKLENVFVTAKIISLEGANEQFGQEITKATNRQNKVENSDFVSFDIEQIRIRDELAIEGISYELNRSEFNELGLTAFDLIESTTALACSSQDVSLVVQLKREIGKLWENLTKSPYKKLFNPSISGIFVNNCVQIQRKIDKQIDSMAKSIDDGRKSGVLIHGNRLISMLVFRDINPTRLTNSTFSVKTEILDSYITETIDKYFKVLFYIFENTYPNAIIPTFFKNSSKCQAIVDLVPEFLNYGSV